MKISVNIINYNNMRHVDGFIDGLYEVLSGLEYEINLVDSMSEDKSHVPLTNIADNCLRMECTRGEARNICLMMSTGDITIDCIDTDQIPQPELRDLIDWFIEENPNFCLNTNGCMINNGDIVRDIGFGEGYQAGEDKYLWDRLIQGDEIRYVKVNTAKHGDRPNKKEPPAYNPMFRYPRKLHEFRLMELEEKIKCQG